ncbi:endogenous retrovirus group K member 5 Gag polyprotein-like isoform X1 [Notamacropus eugenii]|uniref:endogenous retrovirus group K member 5 Gag polyprotein-like isoform X1 n=1 Tax=Notamacropus eugenii TaxID=9315 RepID=UPI003B682752
MLHWSDSPGPQSSLEKGIRKAIENGEDVGTFPVLEIADPSVPGGVRRSHIPIEWKRVATLKEACTKHGPNSPFVIAVLETLSGQFVLTPNDWKSLARACLTPGQNVIWVSEFSQRVKSTTSGLGAQAPQAYQRFTGTGQFEATGNQLQYSAANYVLIAGMAIAAWKVIASKKEREFPMTRITQGNTEPFTNFVARLQEAVGRDMGEENQGTEIVLRTLLRQNCNHDCKKAMLGLPKNASVEEMIQRCDRVGSQVYLAQVQGKYLAAALSNISLEKKCFNCGKPGHLKKECRKEISTGRGQDPCFSCGKPGHLARQCRKSGNGVRGPSRAPKVYPLAENQDGPLEGEYRRLWGQRKECNTFTA